MERNKHAERLGETLLGLKAEGKLTKGAGTTAIEEAQQSVAAAAKFKLIDSLAWKIQQAKRATWMGRKAQMERIRELVASLVEQCK